VFDFSEDEVDTLWASVDANATGVIARPRAALLLKRAVILQHGKMGAMVQDKLAKEEAIEAGSIRGIPRWMQWCARETERQRDRETERQRDRETETVCCCIRHQLPRLISFSLPSSWGRP
jgi:hypothetical protein